MLGGVSSAPIVVHRLSLSGGRRATVHSYGQDEILGTADSDHDLVVFLEGTGIAAPRGHLGRPGVGGVARRPPSRATLSDVRESRWRRAQQAHPAPVSRSACAVQEHEPAHDEAGDDGRREDHGGVHRQHRGLRL